MQFSVDKNNLLSHIQKVSKVSPTRSTMPILNSILFDIKENQLTLRSSDIEITMNATLNVNGKEDGAVALPTRIIYDIINEAEEGELILSSDTEGACTLKSGKGVFEIMGRPGDEFPSLPKISNFNDVEIENSTLRRMIQKTIIAVSKDELKPALMGVLFQIKRHEIRTVATDGHRLVCLIRQDFQNEAYEGEVIIPVKFLNLLLGYLDSEGTTLLSISENHVKVELDSTVIYSRIIDEHFPDYESVIPKDNDKIISMDLNSLLSTIRRVVIFSNKTTHQISLSLSKNITKISTVNQESRTSADEEVDINYSGDDMVVGYNAEYLKEILRNVDTNNVILKLKSSISACLILPEEQKENEDFTMLLMPIRLNE
ncbi:DNA polymerase III subunit beta [bacterium]|nr:DNA polymerase III subunit beta [bacterium]